MSNRKILYAGRDYYIHKGSPVRDTINYKTGWAIGVFEEDQQSLYVWDGKEVDLWYVQWMKLLEPGYFISEEECDKLLAQTQ